MMLITGTMAGGLGVVLAHVLTAYAARYYLILVFPLVMALFLGTGLSLGARAGGCTRRHGGAVVVVLLCTLGCYGALLFMNDHYDKLVPRPANVAQAWERMIAESQHFLGTLPVLSKYLKPTDPIVGDRGTDIGDFLAAVPDLAQATPVVIGTIFDRALFRPVKNVVVVPGVTAWDDERGALVFAASRVKTWMRWAVEALLVFVIALVMTRGGNDNGRNARTIVSDDTSNQHHQEQPKEHTMENCRDCRICTRLGIVKILYAPFTFLYKVLFSWNVGLFLRKCPQCGHFMSAHNRRADGSFKD
jgi:hypothetical protein